jgi:hypothetical protein
MHAVRRESQAHGSGILLRQKPPAEAMATAAITAVQKERMVVFLK